MNLTHIWTTSLLFYGIYLFSLFLSISQSISKANIAPGDKKHGIGSFTFIDGGKYTGRFVQDTISGQGKYQYPDGRCYEGEWKDNKKHGVGVYDLGNGMTYQGVFINGKRNGKGKLTW